MAQQLVGRSGEDAAVDPSANSMDDLIGGGGAAVDRSALVDDPAPAEDGEAAQLGDDSPNELLLITSSFEHQHENRREWQKVRDSVSSSPRSLRAKSGSPHSCVTVSPMACGKRAEERLAILEDFEKRLKAANAWALQTDDPHFIIHSITHQSLASHDDENEEHQRRLLAESRGSPSPLSPPMAKIFLPPMAKSQRPSPSPRLPPDGENASAVDGYSNGDALSEEKRSREEMLREPQEMTRQLTEMHSRTLKERMRLPTEMHRMRELTEMHTRAPAGRDNPSPAFISRPMLGLRANAKIAERGWEDGVAPWRGAVQAIQVVGDSGHLGAESGVAPAGGADRRAFAPRELLLASGVFPHTDLSEAAEAYRLAQQLEVRRMVARHLSSSTDARDVVSPVPAQGGAVSTPGPHYQQTPYTPFTPYMPSSPPSLANGDPSSSGWQVRAQPETEREGGREGEEGREREGGREREREPPYQQMPYTPYTPYTPSLANGELHGGSWGPVRSLAVTPPPPPVTSTTSFARGFNFVASDTQQVTPSVSLLPLQ